MFLWNYRSEQSKLSHVAALSFFVQLAGFVFGIIAACEPFQPGQISVTPFVVMLACGAGWLLLTIQWLTTRAHWSVSPQAPNAPE
jgi:hypothetical protein